MFAEFRQLVLELHDHDGDVPQGLLNGLSLVGDLAHFQGVLLLLPLQRFVLRGILSSFRRLLVNLLLLLLFLAELGRHQLQLLFGFDETLFEQMRHFGDLVESLDQEIVLDLRAVELALKVLRVDAGGVFAAILLLLII